MATMAQILAKSHREVGYVLFLEGCPFAVTNRYELAGSYEEFSWIGAANGNRTVYEGLDFPESVSYETSAESGMLDSGDGATFLINDFDLQMIAYHQFIEDPDSLGVRLSPKDDPAPFDSIDQGGNNVGLWGRFVNQEAIGQFGERAQFQLFPGNPMPGLDHAAFNGTELTIAPTNVYDAPTALDGRRVALYRIYKDHELDSWPAWGTQYEANRPLWYGTITSTSGEGRTWRLQCDGPSSWLRRPLNRNRPTEWKPVDVVPRVQDTRFAVEFRYLNAGFSALYGGSSYWTVDDEIPPSATPEDILSAVNSRLHDVAAMAGPDMTYTVEHNAKAEMTQSGDRVYMRAKIDDNIFGYAAQYTITMDIAYWRQLGFEPTVQTPPGAPTTVQDIFFYPQSPDGTAPGTFNSALIPLEYGGEGGHQWTALIQTIPLGKATVTEAGNDSDNSGKWRAYEALVSIGGATLAPVDATPVTQELLGGVGQGYYLEGQTKRALRNEHEFSNGGGTADTVGYFLAKGTYTPEKGEPSTRVEVLELAWRDDTNSIGRDDLGRERLTVQDVIDPKWFGMTNSKDRWLFVGSGGWAVNDLEICPIAILGYRDDFGDRADMVLLSTMLGTGTSYWTGYEEDASAVRTIGANDHPDAIYPSGSDTEIADLTLGIYHGLINWTSFLNTAKQMPDDGENSPLNRCKYAYIGPFDSQELIARILAPRAWSMGFVNGQYMLFFRPQELTYEDATMILGPDDFVEDAPGSVFVEKVDLTPHIPKDRFEISYGEPLLSDTAPEKDIEPFSINAQDPASHTRHSNAEVSIDGAGLVPFTLWKGNNPNSEWQTAFNKLWGKIMASYYGAPYLKVSKITVQHSKGRLLGPGSVVRFESSNGPSRDGVYALSNKIGRVTKVTHNLKNLTTEVSILIQPGSVTAQRRWAPIAQVLDMVDTVEERHDPASRTFFCYKNAFEHEGPADLHDVSYFEEPNWLGIGGNALVLGWQWNGRTWAQTFSFEVENVNAADDKIIYRDGSFSGTFHEAMTTYLVLAPYDDQTLGNWTRSLYSVITGSDFKFGAGPTKGFKLI